ncbi:DUF488 domain-containing protein [Vreelandella boliviensis]|uniref:DUF488 domain-containing protein n=1 Tax=Vreelandella boliviensis TaxID=223527 RepID=UPI001B8ADD9B|nr:DUF488 family protein [Halomonas boliviensis]MBS3667832.1 DUF488 family protein [Halomonas boliviensis]
MDIELKRAYDSPHGQDGYRVLVDGIWPRGVSKEEAKIDEWRKEVAPSSDLRKAFHNGSLGWGDFRQRYLKELTACRESLRDLAQRAKKEKITLVFASKEDRHNNAEVLRQYLKMLQ